MCFSRYFPKALPKVPVPELDSTMAEYLRLLEPVLTPSHHEKTKAIVSQFISGPGPMLQKYLQDKREADLNWVSSLFTLFPIPNSICNI